MNKDISFQVEDNSALREKIVDLNAVEFLNERAKSVDENQWQDIFVLVPDAEPEEFDLFPSARKWDTQP